MASSIKITGLMARDIRFPTSRTLAGSDAMHPSPDYSAAYVTLQTDDPSSLEGHGLTFTSGRGTEVVLAGIQALKPLVVGWSLESIIADFRSFWRSLTSDGQLRWIGPEKGVIHLATSAIVNALWDLYAKVENKPVWKLLVDMTPEQIASVIDFRYITDALTPEEAIEILRRNSTSKEERESVLMQQGYPAYTTSAGWLGYSDEKLRRLCREGLAAGWNQFKMKVGTKLADDVRRAEIIREEIGWDRKLMMDANEIWDVDTGVAWIKELARFKPWWIEEPTSPDDVLGHAAIAHAIAPIAIATGEQCQNRVIFKQLFQLNAIRFCQIDACRLGGVNEVLAVLLMAAKFGIPVCPHAGGVGLCEYVQHYAMFDYICVSASLDNRVVEYIDHLHEHFEHPVVMKNGRYMPPRAPGFSVDMRPPSLAQYEFPSGIFWLG